MKQRNDQLFLRLREEEIYAKNASFCYLRVNGHTIVKVRSARKAKKKYRAAEKASQKVCLLVYQDKISNMGHTTIKIETFRW